jgi:hypothetical protein
MERSTASGILLRASPLAQMNVTFLQAPDSSLDIDVCGNAVATPARAANATVESFIVDVGREPRDFRVLVSD